MQHQIDLCLPSPVQTMSVGFSGGLINLLPSTLEEWLNGRVEEGKHGSLELVNIDAEVLWSSSTGIRGFLALVMLVSETLPVNSGSLTAPTPFSLEQSLKAIVGDEFAFQVISFGGTKPGLWDGNMFHYPISGSLQIPPKWRELGICESDEDRIDVGNRSNLAVVFLLNTLAGNTAAAIEGRLHLRYNEQDVINKPVHLLEGVG